tara:strand:- start:1429 stop:2064 length:636 start_codon:yes stop_codon:yes gene_type:complete
MMRAKEAIGSSRPGRPEKYSADEVLRTALSLYWTEGVSMLSVNSVARRMGIPKPSLYRHFPSEDALHASVLLSYEETVLANLNDIMHKPAPFPRQLDEILDALIGGMKGHSRGCLLFQMRDLREDLGPLAQDAINGVYSRFCTAIKKWLETAARRGEVILKTDSLTTTYLFLGLITLIRNGFRDGLNEAGIRTLTGAHLAGLFQQNKTQKF